jgi:hypothetical protein
VRLGVLGPARGDLVGLATAAQVLLDKAAVEKVIYLGADDTLDRVVSAWASELVGGNPSEELMFERAAQACAIASADAIEAFVASERARRRLGVLTSVPRPPGRTIELFDGRIAVIVYDKATLDEDDIAGATLLVFGKSEPSVVHPIGSRLFFSPGALGPDRGIAAIDDQGGGIRIELYDLDGHTIRTERVDARLRGAKMRIQGSSEGGGSVGGGSSS